MHHQCLVHRNTLASEHNRISPRGTKYDALAQWCATDIEMHRRHRQIRTQNMQISRAPSFFTHVYHLHMKQIAFYQIPADKWTTKCQLKAYYYYTLTINLNTCNRVECVRASAHIFRAYCGVAEDRCRRVFSLSFWVTQRMERTTQCIAERIAVSWSVRSSNQGQVSNRRTNTRPLVYLDRVNNITVHCVYGLTFSGENISRKWQTTTMRMANRIFGTRKMSYL